MTTTTDTKARAAARWTEICNAVDRKPVPAHATCFRGHLLVALEEAEELRPPPAAHGHSLLWLVHEGASLRVDYTADDVELDDDSTAVNVTVWHLWAGGQDVCELVHADKRQAIADEVEQHLESRARDDAEQARISAHMDFRDTDGFGF